MCGLTFVGQKRLEIEGYCDASHASCRTTAKSVTSCVTTAGVTASSSKSQKQPTKSMITAQSEYLAACSVSEESCLLKSVSQELNFGV